MRNLDLCVSECINNLHSIGINPGNIVDVKVNTRAKKRWGQCVQRDDGYSININQFLLYEESDIDGLYNTIYHELLHTCKGCMNHGTEWKRLAGIVYKELGYNIKRCSSDEEKGVCEEGRIQQTNRRRESYKYEITCKCCGKTYIRKRRCNVDTHRCGVCGGKLKIKLVLD